MDDLKNNNYMLQCDDDEHGLYFNGILSRESSVAGHSSRIYYRAAEGVPFKWEMQPGTPFNPPEVEVVPPLNPPPQVLGKGLPRPNIDQPKGLNYESKVWLWKKIKVIDLYRKARNLSRGKKVKTSESFGEFNDQISSSSFTTSTSYSSSNHGFIRESLDAPFCCSPWNITEIMEEGNRRIYYCRDHKTAFALENDGSFLSKILTRVSSSVDQSFRLYNNKTSEELGVPFQWEMLPGRPKYPPEVEIIPPPSPPPALQSLTFPLPSPHIDPIFKATRSKRSRILVWIKSKKIPLLNIINAIENDQRVGKEISFRIEDTNNNNNSNNNNEFNYYCSDDYDEESFNGRDSVSRSSSYSVYIPKSNEHLKLSKFRRDFFAGHFCFKPWKI